MPIFGHTIIFIGKLIKKHNKIRCNNNVCNDHNIYMYNIIYTNNIIFFSPLRRDQTIDHRLLVSHYITLLYFMLAVFLYNNQTIIMLLLFIIIITKVRRYSRKWFRRYGSARSYNVIYLCIAVKTEFIIDDNIITVYKGLWLRT